MPETLLNFWCWCVKTKWQNSLAGAELSACWCCSVGGTTAGTWQWFFVLPVPHCSCHRGQCPAPSALRWPLGEDHGVDVRGGALCPLHRLHSVPHRFLEKESLKVAGETVSLSRDVSPLRFSGKTNFAGGWSGTFYWIMIKTSLIFFILRNSEPSSCISELECLLPFHKKLCFRGP